MHRNALLFRSIFMVILPASVAFVAVNGQSVSRKEPWQWTAQERADALRDPAQRLERLRDYREENRSSRIAANTVPTAADVIDGSIHPELYFPTQLFEYLVRMAFVTLPHAYPHIVRQRSSDLFKNPAEWDRFATIVGPYAKVLTAEKAAADAVRKDAVASLQVSKCLAEAKALRESRRVFGPARFDRMLYETVPASMRTTFSIDTDFQTVIRTDLEREKRCQ